MIKVDDLYPLILDAFNNDKTFTMPIKGTSMQPLLKTGMKVELEKIGEVKPNDILFYKRSNGGFVLHRLIEIKDSKYIMSGDHQLDLEEISCDQCFARVKAYYTKKNIKKELRGFKYKLYLISLNFSLVRRLYIRWL